MARDLENLVVPPLGAIMAFRGVWALTTITDEGRLRATHYATCLIGGREPMWGVWSINGVFQRFFGSRDQIQNDRHYKRLSWRRKNATWNMIGIETRDREVDERRAELRSIYKHNQSNAQEPVAALLEDGTIATLAQAVKSKKPYRPLFAGPVVDMSNVVPFTAKDAAA